MAKSIKQISCIPIRGKYRVQYNSKGDKIQIHTGISVGKLNLGAISPVLKQLEMDLNLNILQPTDVYKKLFYIFGNSRFGKLRMEQFRGVEHYFKFIWFSYLKFGIKGLELDENNELCNPFILSALDLYKKNPNILNEIQFLKAFDSSFQNESASNKEDTFKKDYSTEFKKWAISVKQASQFNAHYAHVHGFLKKQGIIDLNNLPAILDKQNTWSADTYNRVKNYLTGFIDHLILREKLKFENPLTHIENKKIIRISKKERTPFKPEEISKILNALKSNKFVTKFSGYKDSFYFPFVAFLAYTGCRPQEAAGLKCKYVHLNKNVVEIREVISLNQGIGDNSKEKSMKGTKNNKIRNIPMHNELKKILSLQIKDKQDDDFVFPNRSDKDMDFDNFQKRVFKKVLENLKIPRRDLYSFRHSFASNLIEIGTPIQQVAYLLGDSQKTILDHYSHLINEVKVLPTFFELNPKRKSNKTKTKNP